MLVLVSYDVATIDSKGQRRLRLISKKCLDYGQRVQNSVFECNMQYDKFVSLRKALLDIYDEKEDSIRFYLLGNKWENKVEHYGVKESYNAEGVLII